MLNLAVVGHVEWVTHTDAPFIPPAGEIVHLTDPLIQPAGGGAVTAAALARMGAGVQFFTAAGGGVAGGGAMGGLGARRGAAPRPGRPTRSPGIREPRGGGRIRAVGGDLRPGARG